MIIHRFMKQVIVVLLVALSGWVPHAANADNIMKDPDFESSPAGRLEAWKGMLWIINGTYPGKAEVIADKSRARTGEKFLSLEFEKEPGMQNNFMIVFDKYGYPVIKDKKYILKVWVRGQGTVSIGVQRYDKGGQWLPSRGGQGSGFVPIDNLEAWQELSASYIAGDDASTLQFNISATGKIDVDDASLEIVDCTAEELQASQSKQKQAAKPPVRTTTTPAVGPDKSNEVLGGGFENWTVRSELPADWDVPGNLVPEKWFLENRPDEKGSLRRIACDPESTDASFGATSLLLNGRLVSQYTYMPVKDKKFQVSLMARGVGGKVVVRLREYTGPTNRMYVLHVMEILDTSTEDAWRKYTAQALVPSTSAGPLPTGASLEIIGQDVMIDNVQVKLVEAERQYSPIIYKVPVSQDQIVIDGDFSEQEWSRASGANIGFVMTGGNLVKRQAAYYLSADQKNLLLCLRTPFTGSLKQNVRERDGQVWDDDSYEIHFNPSVGMKTPPLAYQFIVNALGTVYDAAYTNNLRLPESKDWNCEGLKVASKCEDNIWTLELAIPLAVIGVQANQDFGFNLCKNLKNPLEDSNLTGYGYFDYDKMVVLRIDKERPTLFWGSMGAIGDANLNLYARIVNPSVQSRECEIAFAVDAEQVTKQETRALTLPESTQETLYFNTDKHPGAFGEIEIKAQDSAAKTAIVAHKINFDLSSLLAQETTGNKIAWYPVQNKIGITLTAAQLGKVAKVEVTVRHNDRQVEKTATDKIEIAEDQTGQAMVNFAPGEEGTYLVSAVVFDADGNGLGYAADEIVVQKFAWQNNECGKGKAINRPFTPISVSGQTMSCWGRTYHFSGSGLPEQIVSQDEEVLKGAVAFAWTDGDKAVYGKAGEFKVTKRSDQSVEFTGETVFKDFTIVTHGRLEYDGTIFYDFDIVAAKDATIPNLHFEMPFQDLKYFHTSAFWMSALPEEGDYLDQSVPIWTPDYMYIPKGVREHNSLYFPEGDGTIWTSKNISAKKTQGDFLPYLTFGNARYGMCWFTENDRGWRRDARRPSFEIIRAGETAKVKINLISHPLKSEQASRISFALAATPVRPKKIGFNYLDWGVMGFGDSSFIDGAIGGLGVKDDFLMNKYVAARDPKGDFPILFYIAKAYFTLGDPVARYFYNEWHTLPEESYNVRGTMPTKKYGSNPDNYFAPAGCLYPERVDYTAFKIDAIIKNNPRLRGIYWDENYSVACLDIFHKNCGFRLEDGTIQAGTHNYGTRELDKRVESILQKYNRPFPNLLVHSTAMIPPVFSFADINLCAERGTKNLDFIDYWDWPRIENTAIGAWGINIMWIPMWGSTQQGGPNTVANNRSMLAALKLFDMNIWQIQCRPELLAKYRALENVFGISADDSRFFGYWQKENKQAITGLPVFVKSSFFVRPSKGAFMYVSNLNKEKQTVQMQLDFSQWNLTKIQVLDAETNQEIKRAGTAIMLDVESHDFRTLLIVPVP